MREDEMDSNSDVTVIILTCGEFGGLERTLNSIIGQTYPISSIIVSDDSARGKFPPALQRRFPNIKFRINGENVGTVAHMNKAAQGVQSKYIKFLAEGDAFSDPESLKALIVFAEDKDVPAVTSQSMVCDKGLNHRFYPFPGKRAKRLRWTGEKLFQVLSLSNFISAPGTLFHRSFFTHLGGFDESYHLLEDWPTWLRLARKGYAIPCLDRVTCLYAMGGISSENLDAYHSPKLRQDMVLCYEKEIFPYLGQFSTQAKRQVQYGYDLVCGATHKELLKKYGWLERKATWKRSVKRWILKR